MDAQTQHRFHKRQIPLAAGEAHGCGHFQRAQDSGGDDPGEDCGGWEAKFRPGFLDDSQIWYRSLESGFRGEDVDGLWYPDGSLEEKSGKQARQMICSCILAGGPTLEPNC